jgi:glucosamine 6-phosphate synthetase-like amidotransferase/phosphosugar isomerase protein
VSGLARLVMVAWGTTCPAGLSARNLSAPLARVPVAVEHASVSRNR